MRNHRDRKRPPAASCPRFGAGALSRSEKGSDVAPGQMAAMATVSSSTSVSATATAVALGEVEDEGLLASLFRDRFPEAQWRERPDVGRYLRELSGSGLERLRREPERLAEERAQLLQQTRDLAFANYKTFIRGAECTERIHRLFGDVEASLGCLLDRLPSFQQSCRCGGPALKGLVTTIIADIDHDRDS